MKPIAEVLNQEDFLMTLFQAIPCGVLIIDSQRRVQAVNNVIEQSIGTLAYETVGMLGGEALKCINALKEKNSCGYSENCQACMVRGQLLKRLTASGYTGKKQKFGCL